MPKYKPDSSVAIRGTKAPLNNPDIKSEDQDLDASGGRSSEEFDGDNDSPEANERLINVVITGESHYSRRTLSLIIVVW